MSLSNSSSSFYQKMAAFPLMTAERRGELLERFYATQLDIIDELVAYLVPLYRYFAQELESRNTEASENDGDPADAALSATRVSRLKSTQLKNVAKILMDIKIAHTQTQWDLIDGYKAQIRDELLGFDYALLSTIASAKYAEPVQVFILKEKQAQGSVEKLKALLQKADDDRELLFKGNWRLVMEIARRFEAFGSKLDLDEMIQEGNAGLLAAIDKFNPTLQNQLSTLAANWIQAKIRRALDNLSETIRTPVYKRQRKKLVQKAEMELLAKAGEDAAHKPQQLLTGAEKLFGRSVDDKAIAEKTGLDIEEVKELRRLYPETVSINATVDGSEDEHAQERGDLLADPAQDEESHADKADKNIFFALLTRLVDDLTLEHQVVLSGLNGLPIRKAKLIELVKLRNRQMIARGEALQSQNLSLSRAKALVQVFK